MSIPTPDDIDGNNNSISMLESERESSDLHEIESAMSLIQIDHSELETLSTTDSNLIINYLPYEFTEADLEVGNSFDMRKEDCLNYTYIHCTITCCSIYRLTQLLTYIFV
jgi:hypothetical protein